MRNLMLCILLLSAYASAEVRFYGSLGSGIESGRFRRNAKAPRKLPCTIWTHMSAFKAGIRLAGKMHPAENGPNHLFPPTTQQTNNNHGNRSNWQILQTRRTNPYSRLFHRKFSDGLKMK